jgi:hypothetical protein
MKDKYIEEEYPVYFVWGKRVDGRVDIATTSDDTVATVSQEHAEKLIQDRNDLVRRLCDMAQAFDRSSPEEFKKFWYGSCLPQPEPVAPRLVYRYSPVTVAECGGPCEQGPQYCDCGEIKGEPAPEPVAPTDEELRKVLYQAICEFPPTNPDAVDLNADQYELELEIRKARAILTRYARPAIEPVPVSERPWEREGWCDAEGRCYGWDGDYWWMVGNPGAANETITHCLPHWALPVPAPANTINQEDYEG